MKNGYSQIIQSKYFITDFNSAIFDGPIRIYFAQVQESLALKIYFHFQNHLTAEVKKLKELSTNAPFSLFVLVYPTAATFESCWESTEKIMLADWDNDLVLGLNESINGIDFELFNEKFQRAYSLYIEQNKKQKNEEINL